MKKLIYIFSLAFIACTGFATCSDDDNDDILIDYTTLPQNSKDFVSTHFPGTSAIHTTKEHRPDEDGSLYEVRLTNGFEIDFDINGNWTGIEGNYQPIPQSIIDLIPASIPQYCNTNHAGTAISEIDKKTYGYKIELINRLEMIFSLEGNFIHYD